MDKNIAALVRTDTVAVNVEFLGNGGSQYTYITNLPVKKDDLVVVPTTTKWAVAKVKSVGDIPTDSDIKFKVLIAVVDPAPAVALESALEALDLHVAGMYRRNARQALRASLGGLDPVLLGMPAPVAEVTPRSVPPAVPPTPYDPLNKRFPDARQGDGFGQMSGPDAAH